MSTKVVMEALSPTMEEGRVVEWKKQEGEPVAVGDVLAEIETDKAVMELVARAAGTMLKHVVAAGATVPVSELVAVIGEPGEAVDAPSGPNGSKPAPKAEAPKAEAPKPEAPKSEAPATPAAAQGTQPTADRENRPTSMPPAPPAAAVTEISTSVVGDPRSAPTVTRAGG